MRRKRKTSKLKQNKKLFYGMLVMGMIAIIGFGSATGLFSATQLGENWTIIADINKLEIQGLDVFATDSPIEIAFSDEGGGGIHILGVEFDESYPIVPMGGETVSTRDSFGYPGLVVEIANIGSVITTEREGDGGVIIYTYELSFVIQIATVTEKQTSGGYLYDFGTEGIKTMYDYAEMKPFIGNVDASGIEMEATFSIVPLDNNVVGSCVFTTANAASVATGQKSDSDSVLSALSDWDYVDGRIYSYAEGDVNSNLNDANNVFVVSMDGNIGSGGQAANGEISVYEGFIQVPIDLVITQEVDVYDTGRFDVPWFLAMLPTSLSMEDLSANPVMYLLGISAFLGVGVLLPTGIAYWAYSSKKPYESKP